MSTTRCHKSSATADTHRMDGRMEALDSMEGGVVSDTDMMKGGGCRGEDITHGILREEEER